MDVELQINNSASPAARFVIPSGVSTPTVSIGITATSAAGGGAVRFRRGTTGAFSNSLTLHGPDQWRLGSVFRRRQVRAAQRQ